jgi:protein O-GlcNAc transferase
MNKIISFSVWGHDQRYLKGALRNIQEARRVYPDWKCRFYVDNSVSLSDAKTWHDEGAEVYKIDSKGAYHGMFWRFFPAGDPTVDVMISRDADSRVNEREAAAVEEWLNSPFGFHIIRDHSHHVQHIQGGLWGAKKNTIPQIKQLIREWKDFSCKGIDQGFLYSKVFPLIKDNYLAHDDDNDKKPLDRQLKNAKPFPKHKEVLLKAYCFVTKREGFCGAIFNEHDKPDHWRPY